MGKKEIMNDRFADLTEKEAHVLCYIAFFGEAYGTLSAAFIKSIKLSSKKFEALISRLKELNYLVGTNSVNPDKHLDVLDYLAIERQQWLDGFRQIGLYHRTQQAEYLWRITELCQHFIGCTNDTFYKDRNSVETKYEDFEKSKSFEKLLSLIKALEKESIIISKIMILGSPAFRYIKDCCERYCEGGKVTFLPIDDSEGYWHALYLDGRQIDIMYSRHPSYSKYYDWDGDSSRLIPELTRFFS